ncbi:HpcH/HpaI aldolase/citrate lyase family protein [Nitratifractor salsuginis]|uniref:HpcH/HpaI aldolase n=1 Tax=Nitratifractor salsuginis (strain DSM 16511 / JCM 12458 / E9I37-1) TaxID=749222 RepID=E6WXS5_NITSE|nr:aldolase/citrate lyase family protein [Nitratifractor salsuginis]ADV46332.1 HpcH/HpaI aldolase [Nitratifractor salsuginis DSM 16511]
MIFENISAIESLSPVERQTCIGSGGKALCPRRRHRSNMILNPLMLKHMNRLDELEADWVTLNLEDAIAPSRKKEALVNIALFLSHLERSNSCIVVRVNPLELGGEAEIRFLNDFAIDAIRLPKVRSKAEIETALALLPEDRELHISLETKEAFRDLAHWGGIDPRLSTANLGILDLLADLGLPQRLVTQGPGNPTAEAILTRFLVDARIAGLLPVSFMYQDYKDLEGFRRWCEREREMGFEAKACMGPAQVAIANEIFGPDEEALHRAREIKEAFEAASAKGIHGFMHERYGFIDEPIYRDALNLLGES